MSLTHITRLEMSVGTMCATAGGDIAIRMGSGGREIQLCDRKGRTHTKYPGLCPCAIFFKYISEVVPGQYLAELCRGCNKIKVVNMVTREVHTAYSGGSLSEKHVMLHAMCSGPGEGSLLVSDAWSEAVIELLWDEGQKQLKEVRRIQVAYKYILGHMYYLSQGDMIILGIPGIGVEAVKLQGGAGHPPLWQLQGEVVKKDINPLDVSCDSEGRVYVADWINSRVLLLNGYTGQVIQQLLQDAGLGNVYRVCCLRNPRQLLVHHYPLPDEKPTLSLYNITFL